jgi:hypothetical protein
MTGRSASQSSQILCARVPLRVMASASFAARRLAAFLICAVLAVVSATVANAQAPSGIPSSTLATPSGPRADEPPAAAAAEEANPPDTSAETAEPADTSVEAPAPAPASAGSRTELERTLHELEYERAHWTNLWPWVAVGSGIGMTALGTVIGVGAAFRCEPNTECASAPWATLLVVVGVAVGTAGTIWLIRTDQGIRELDIQTHRVRTDLDALNHARLVRERGFATLGTTPLNLHFDF